jgi:hypothetical protein
MIGEKYSTQVRKILQAHRNVPPCGEYRWSGAHERYRVHVPSFRNVAHGESEDRLHNCSFLESALINGLWELNLSHRFFLGAHSRARERRPFEESILMFSSLDILETAIPGIGKNVRQKKWVVIRYPRRLL